MPLSNTIKGPPPCWLLGWLQVAELQRRVATLERENEELAAALEDESAGRDAAEKQARASSTSSLHVLY
jgi:uncharacterized small protein (DUF1192 family)